MYEIKKEKQFVMFIDPETQKTYKVNINTGEFIGLRGKPVKTVPSQVRKAVENSRNKTNVLLLLNHKFDNCDWHDCSPARLMMADRLDGVGIKIGYAGCLDQDMIEFLDTKNGLKNLVRISKEYQLTNLSDLMRYFRKEKFFAQYPQYANSEYREWILEIYSCDSYTDEDKKLLAYFIAHGVVEFCQYSGNLDTSLDFLVEKYREMKYWADRLGVKIEKSDFFRQYIEIKRNYRLNEKEINQKLIEKNQLNRGLEFEDDNFIVLVPTTKEEFLDETNQQHNCVARSYFQGTVDGNHNIVFIRKKTCPEVSYVTCEIRGNNIEQFLLSFNRHISTLEETEYNLIKAFYDNYLTHLQNR